MLASVRAATRLATLARSLSSTSTTTPAAAAAAAATATATATATPAAAASAATGKTTVDHDSLLKAKLSVRDLFHIRAFRPGQDDAAFQELDRMCSQGTKTNLVSEFPLDIPFEAIQSGNSLVLEDKANGVMAATNRSYIHDVLVDGIPRKLSYNFLLRVNPAYRNHGLGGYITGLAYKRDCAMFDCDYFSAYVIENNVTSTGVQKKIEAATSLLANYETLGTYSTLAFQLRKDIPLASPLSPEAAAKVTIRHVTDVAEQERIIRASELVGRQLFPVDLPALLKAQLSLGLYVATDAEGRQAGALCWNSGRVRKTYVLNSDVQFDKSVLLHNPFMSDATPESQALLHHLLFTVGNQLGASGEFTSLLTFISTHNPLTPTLVSQSKLHVDWLLKFWQSKGEKRTCDMSNGRTAFFDPRTCLC